MFYGIRICDGIPMLESFDTMSESLLKCFCVTSYKNNAITILEALRKVNKI